MCMFGQGEAECEKGARHTVHLDSDVDVWLRRMGNTGTRVRNIPIWSNSIENDVKAEVAMVEWSVKRSTRWSRGGRDSDVRLNLHHMHFLTRYARRRPTGPKTMGFKSRVPCTHLYPQNSTLGLEGRRSNVNRVERTAEELLSALFHEHPSQRIPNRMWFVVDLICRRRQIGFCTFKLLRWRFRKFWHEQYVQVMYKRTILIFGGSSVVIFGRLEMWYYDGRNSSDEQKDLNGGKVKIRRRCLFWKLRWCNRRVVKQGQTMQESI